MAHMKVVATLCFFFGVTCSVDAFAVVSRASGAFGGHLARAGLPGVGAIGKMQPRMVNAALPADGFHLDSDGKGKPRGVWGLYLEALQTRPIVTKSLTSGAISGTSNLIEQILSGAAFSLTNWASFTMVGAFFIGMTLHHWFNFLERVIHSKAVSSRIKNRWGLVAVQVGLDATIGAAIINSGYFAMQTVFNAVLTGQVFPLPTLVSSIKYKVTSRFVTMMVSNWRVWPWVAFANFAFVPVELRVLVTNIVAVFWGFLMSGWCN